MEHGVGRHRANHAPTFLSQGRDSRLDDFDFFIAKRATFAGMRIESSDRQPWFGDPEIAL